MNGIVPMSKSRLLPMVLAAPLLLALALATFGPVLDHHYAERQHSHDHIYIGYADGDHEHPYETDHVHSYGHYHQASPWSPDSRHAASSSAGGTLYFVTYDMSDQGFASATLAPIALSDLLPNAGSDDFVKGFDSGQDIPTDPFLSKPDHPPRG